MKNPLLAALLLATSASICVAQQVDRSKPMVVVISLDAFGAESLHDPHVPAPTLRRLMASGAYAKSMQPINPTVTWPNHTAMITGVNASKHFVIANGRIEHQNDATITPKVMPWVPKSELVHAPTVYDLAHKAGLTTGEVDWVAITDPGTIDYSFGEEPKLDSIIVKEMIADGTISADDIKNFRKPEQTWRDRAYANAAIDIIKKHHPNLLLVHFLTLDSSEHRYGFNSLASNSAIEYLDGLVKEIVTAVQDAGDADRTTFLVVSDHGQMTVHTRLFPTAMLRAADFTQADAETLPEAGCAYIYAHHPDAAKLAKLRAAFEGKEGIRAVVTPDHYAEYGFADPKVSDQMPDLLVFAQNGYSLSAGDKDPTPKKLSAPNGSHGYPNTEPLMQEIFIANGRGIRTAGEVASFPNVDVAPTIAALLGLKMENIQGKPVTQVLK